MNGIEECAVCCIGFYYVSSSILRATVCDVDEPYVYDSHARHVAVAQRQVPFVLHVGTDTDPDA